MTGLIINGRFLTQRPSGVQRYARELLQAWGSGAGKSSKMNVMSPKAALFDASPLPGPFKVQQAGRLSGHAWEQIELRTQCADAGLINLCNTAPIEHENQLVVIHDAAVWRQPEAYGWRFRTLYRRLLPAIARRSRRLATVSEFSARELRDVMGVGHRKIDIIPNGGDHILRHPSDPAVLETYGLERGRYLFAIGNSNSQKNLPFLKHLGSLLAEHKLQLVVAGGQLAHVFAAHERIEQPNVRHLGYVTDASLRALYEGAMALVFPSLYEGFGIPPLEAMFCGCPVLASNVASIPEVCGGAAAYFDPVDPDSLIKSTKRVLESAAWRDELRLAGLERARGYTWAKAADALNVTMNSMAA